LEWLEKPEQVGKARGGNGRIKASDEAGRGTSKKARREKKVDGQEIRKEQY
jgi:hypothetical protein